MTLFDQIGSFVPICISPELADPRGLMSKRPYDVGKPFGINHNEVQIPNPTKAVLPERPVSFQPGVRCRFAKIKCLLEGKHFSEGDHSPTTRRKTLGDTSRTAAALFLLGSTADATRGASGRAWRDAMG